MKKFTAGLQGPHNLGVRDIFSARECHGKVCKGKMFCRQLPTCPRQES